MARHQPIDSTTLPGLVILVSLDCNAPRSQNLGGQSLEVVPIREHPAARLPARPPAHPKPLEKGNSGTARLPRPSLCPLLIHPPSRREPTNAPTRRQHHSPIGPPDCHSCIFSGCIRCPLQGNWSPRMQCGTVMIVLACVHAPFLTLIAHSVCTQICSALPQAQPDPAQLSPACIPLRRTRA